jgi:hypothetical protein
MISAFVEPELRIIAYIRLNHEIENQESGRAGATTPYATLAKNKPLEEAHQWLSLNLNPSSPVYKSGGRFHLSLFPVFPIFEAEFEAIRRHKSP